MKYKKCDNCTERAIPLLFAGNAILAILKTTIGVMGNSAGLVADGIHSTTDAFSSAMLYFGMKYSEKPADEEHPFGHRNIEFVIAKVVSIFLMLVGIFILVSAIYNMSSGNLVKPDLITLATAMIGIVASGLMSRYGNCVATQLNSLAVKTVAYEIKTDAMTSIAIAIGILCAKLGYPIFDAIAACVVSALIIKNSIFMLRNAMDGLMDHSISPKQKRKICGIILRNENVLKLEFVRARNVGRYLSVEIGIKIDGSKSVEECNNITRDIKGDLMKRMEHLKYININVSSNNPKPENNENIKSENIENTDNESIDNTKNIEDGNMEDENIENEQQETSGDVKPDVG
ncbi:MAG: cation diffusion facilitator family transporter [Candidatus Anammoxibacter sp.]